MKEQINRWLDEADENQSERNCTERRLFTYGFDRAIAEEIHKIGGSS